jgi:hypothetical protein
LRLSSYWPAVIIGIGNLLNLHSLKFNAGLTVS